jgi:hypothetical protein
LGYIIIFRFIHDRTLVFGWVSYVQDQEDFNKPVKFDEYASHMLRDMFENWQSEFLQLIWQVAGLAYLIYVGSPQSKDGSERTEEKLDLILKKVTPDEAEYLIKDLDIRYPRK